MRLNELGWRLNYFQPPFLMKNLKQVATKTIYKNKWVTVREDTVEDLQGKQRQYSVLQAPGGVGIICINDRDEILLERQYRYTIDQVSVEIPEGAVDPPEDFLTAARRELLEETGYANGDWQDLGVLHEWNGSSDCPCQLYLVRNPEKVAEPKLDDDEYLESFWLPIDAGVEMVEENKVTDAISCVAILRAARFIRKFA